MLGFDAVATGHHARIERVGPGGEPRIVRGVDAHKDQSYVIHMLTGEQLDRVLLPIGGMTKDEVRARATELGMRTADKPDSQDVCFISRAGGGRSTFLGSRIPMRPGRLVDADGAEVGTVDAVELVTVGQRRGLGAGGDGEPRYALEVDVPSATVVVGAAEDLMVDAEHLTGVVWVDPAACATALAGAGVTAQASAHGAPIAVAGVDRRRRRRVGRAVERPAAPGGAGPERRALRRRRRPRRGPRTSLIARCGRGRQVVVETGGVEVSAVSWRVRSTRRQAAAHAVTSPSQTSTWATMAPLSGVA